MFNPDQWSTIRGLVDWLDDSNGRSEAQTTLRMLKIVEEAGEVAEAWIGALGQNPRKGVNRTIADVQDELCDVIVTAAVALATISGQPDDVLATRLAKIADRAAVTPS